MAERSVAERSAPAASGAPALLLLAEGDSVLIAVADLDAGPHVASNGTTIVLTGAVPLGHKVAARPIAAAEAVVRCGMPIGSATAPIPAGAWVHVHNLASDYIATFAQRGGTQ